MFAIEKWLILEKIETFNLPKKILNWKKKIYSSSRLELA